MASRFTRKRSSGVSGRSVHGIRPFDSIAPIWQATPITRTAGSASAYRFPFADQAFDFIFLASVFTHMLPDAVEHYVHEISRLLAPGGVCVASYFLLNGETRTGVDAGSSFMSFRAAHPSSFAGCTRRRA